MEAFPAKVGWLYGINKIIRDRCRYTVEDINREGAHVGPVYIDRFIGYIWWGL